MSEIDSNNIIDTGFRIPGVMLPSAGDSGAAGAAGSRGPEASEEVKVEGGGGTGGAATLATIKQYVLLEALERALQGIACLTTALHAVSDPSLNPANVQSKVETAQQWATTLSVAVNDIART